MGALCAINLIKEKTSGILKGHTVADGYLQQHMYDKSQTASSTVSNDFLMLSIMIDAYKQRDVSTADVAGAYLKATMDDFHSYSSTFHVLFVCVDNTGFFL